MHSGNVGRLMDDVLGLVLTLDTRPVPPQQPRRLSALLASLARCEDETRSDELQDLIWAIWSNHADASADFAMQAACEAIAAGKAGAARRILDTLVASWPDWSEAWNKKAIVNFIEHKDAQSLSDIIRVLELEPRHFGAVAGFGHICLRHGRTAEAQAAFAIAVRLNPHLDGLEALIRTLDRQKPLLQ